MDRTDPDSLSAEVKLPAEDVDRFQRPNFITTNDAGMEVCENRLSCKLVTSLSLLRRRR